MPRRKRLSPVDEAVKKLAKYYDTPLDALDAGLEAIMSHSPEAERLLRGTHGLDDEWGPEPTREHASGPLPEREFTPAFRIYDLRHTSVTLELMDGVPVNVVADRHGHETAAFTIARYGHALPKQQREATEKKETLLFRTA